MDYEHPAVRKAIDAGHPYYPFSGRRNEVGVDPLGHEIHTGDEVMVLHDEIYLRRELMQQSIEVLESLGATIEIAQ